MSKQAAMIAMAEEYVKWDPNTQTRSEIAAMITSEPEKLSSFLGSRLAFGTAGLRGPMGPGYNRMNDLVVMQTAQGLARYIESVDAAAKTKVE